MPSGCGRRPSPAADRPRLWTTPDPPLWAVGPRPPRRVADVSLEQTVERGSGGGVLRLTSDQVSVTVVPGLGGHGDLATSAGPRLARTPWGLPQRGAPTLAGGVEAAMLDTSRAAAAAVPLRGPLGRLQHGGALRRRGPAGLDGLERDRLLALQLQARLRRTPFVLTRTVSVLGGEATLRETVHNVAPRRWRRSGRTGCCSAATWSRRAP